MTDNRCDLTQHICGTDTWQKDNPPDCRCGKIERLQAELREAKEEANRQMEGILKIRSDHGARDSECFPDFVSRLKKEKEAAEAELREAKEMLGLGPVAALIKRTQDAEAKLREALVPQPNGDFVANTDFVRMKKCAEAAKAKNASLTAQVAVLTSGCILSLTADNEKRHDGKGYLTASERQVLEIFVSDTSAEAAKLVRLITLVNEIQLNDDYGVVDLDAFNELIGIARDLRGEK